MLPSLPFLFGPAYLLTTSLKLENSHLFKPDYWYKKNSNRVQMNFKGIKQPWPESGFSNSRNCIFLNTFEKFNFNPTTSSSQVYRGHITTNKIQRVTFWKNKPRKNNHKKVFRLRGGVNSSRKDCNFFDETKKEPFKKKKRRKKKKN